MTDRDVYRIRRQVFIALFASSIAAVSDTVSANGSDRGLVSTALLFLIISLSPTVLEYVIQLVIELRDELQQENS